LLTWAVALCALTVGCLAVIPVDRDESDASIVAHRPPDNPFTR
jgi:hypothetical protein